MDSAIIYLKLKTISFKKQSYLFVNLLIFKSFASLTFSGSFVLISVLNRMYANN
jgi:hypothetical protein